MYSKDIIKASILLYYKLKNNKIIGKKRSNIIYSVFNLHMNTLYNWIKLYYNKIDNTFNFSSYKTNFKYNNLKITNNIENFIINCIDSNNNFNIKKIKHNINLKFNISLSKNSIYLNQKPYKGWSKKGSNCFIKTKNKTIFNKRYSIGMSIDIKCKIDFTIVEGSLKSNKFMKKIMTSSNYIFMDNASIHKNILFKQFINNNFNVIYNIPYYFELNPIEYIFSLLRKELLNNCNSTYQDIINTIVNFIKKFNSTYSYNIFNKCFNILL